MLSKSIRLNLWRTLSHVSRKDFECTYKNVKRIIRTQGVM